MSFRPYSPNKAKRMILVWEVLKGHGRVSPELVIREVARKSRVDPEDKNFKRNIYRDLQDLALDGDLNVEYFKPDGQRVKPEEEEITKNLRAEYYILGNDGHFPGGGLFAENDMLFVPQKRAIIHWAANRSSVGVKSGHISLILPIYSDDFLVLSVSHYEVPFKILVARKNEIPQDNPRIADIEEAYGMRSSVLLLNKKSVSRYEKGAGPRNGHAVFEFSNEGDSFQLIDLNSTNGSYWADAPESAISLHFSRAESDLSIPYTLRDIMTTQDESSWKKVVGSSVVRLPAFVKLGTYIMLVHSLPG